MVESSTNDLPRRRVAMAVALLYDKNRTVALFSIDAKTATVSIMCDPPDCVSDKHRNNLSWPTKTVTPYPRTTGRNRTKVGACFQLSTCFRFLMSDSFSIEGTGLQQN